MTQLIKDENLNMFTLHFHITPGLIDDYEELCKTIISETKVNDPKCVYIIRLKMKNLNEQDIDSINLPNSISTHKRLCSPLINVFELDSRANEDTINNFIDSIMQCIIQDIQSFVTLKNIEL